MIGTELDGRYRILAELGSGGAGTVYRAVHLERQSEVAVKVLRPELASSVELRHRFAREARALTALVHPNIVGVVDTGVASDTAYLVMELLEGETLSARLKRGPLPVAEALAIMRELLSALAFVHEQRLVHRDVKPANVFLQANAKPGARVRLLDFGLAKFLAPEAGGPSLTRAGQVFGTPSYMAPEQIAGQQADPRTDVYAAGIVLFEMLAGRVPFQGEASEVLRRHIMEDLPIKALPPDVPQPVIDMIKTASAKTRPGRYADAREMLQELERVAKIVKDAASPAASGPEVFAPTLALAPRTPAAKVELSTESSIDDRVTAPEAPFEERPTVEERIATPAEAPSADDAAAAGVHIPGERKSLLQRLLRFGTTVAILVSLAGAAIAALAIYLLVTPGREEERRVIETALGLPSASASVAPFHPKTLRSMKAWPSGSESAEAPQADEAPPNADTPEPENAQNAAPPASAAAPEEPNREPAAPPTAGSAPEPSEPANDVAERPAGPVPPNPWASTPGELLRLMGRASKTRGFDKRDMRELHQYNGKHPTDPRGHLLLARGYTSRHWVKDAANEYAIAVKVNDSARGDPHLLSDLIRLVQLGSDEAAHLVVEVFGPAAAPAVDHALAAQGRPEVKARLERLRADLGT